MKSKTLKVTFNKGNKDEGNISEIHYQHLLCIGTTLFDNNFVNVELDTYEGYIKFYDAKNIYLGQCYVGIDGDVYPPEGPYREYIGSFLF